MRGCGNVSAFKASEPDQLIVVGFSCDNRIHRVEAHFGCRRCASSEWEALGDRLSDVRSCGINITGVYAEACTDKAPCLEQDVRINFMYVHLCLFRDLQDT